MSRFLPKRRQLRLRLFFEGLIIGIFTGVVVAAFRFLIDEADVYRPIYFALLKSKSDLFMWILTITILIFTAYLITKFIKIDAQIAGSGVPQIKGILQGRMHLFRPFRLLIMKFAASTIAISAGLSLGRAGLSVQFGACIGAIFNHILGRHHIHESSSNTIEGKFLLNAGAGAGLAAIFNAPLAGVVFCIEELQKKYSPELLMVSMTAAVSASAVVKSVFGIRPVFETITPTLHSVPLISTTPTINMLSSMTPFNFIMYLICLGFFTGLLGVGFTKSLILSLNAYDKIAFKGVQKFLIPLFLVIPIGLVLPEVLGCGNLLVDDMLSNHFALSLLIILFTAKFLFTMICFGTGAPGGIFLPLLVLGALIGNIFALVGITVNLFNAEWTAMFIIFGMAGYFAAVVKAPITGSILIMELTGSFSHLLALIIVSGVAFLVSDLFGGKPAYSALLERSINQKIDK
ncbi:MAG: ClC family H(+)/Cl(-) exchange transporter [Selenomonadaceae bacterium]|nr:ClC family H(+)/Cl(-) exchange transporter [Selenomonadaceae bacterium]